MRLFASLSLAGLSLAGMILAQQATVENAWNLVASGKRQEAVSVLRQVISQHPRDPEARLLLGSIFAEDGKAAEAISEISEAVRLTPRSAVAHNALGEVFNTVGDLKAAREAFEKAATLDPKFAQAYVNLGLLFSQAGEGNRAAEHLDRALALIGATPDAAYPQYLRAKIHTEQGQFDKAAELLKRAVALQPDFAEAWSDLGQARKNLLDDAGAFAAFQQSVRLDPQNAISQYRLGAEYLRQGKAREAVAHLQESFRLNPKNQSTLYNLQLALRQDGQLVEARRVKEKLAELLRNIDKESQNAFVALKLNNEAAVLEKAGDLRAAVEKYQNAVTLDPAHIGFRLNYGVALLRLGKWSEGLAQLREALRRDPSNGQAKAVLEDALAQAPVEFGGRRKSQTLVDVTDPNKNSK
jgi:superkiller protein 3